MKRWERPLLLFSIALNVAFVAIGATRRADREAAAGRFFAPDSPRAAQRLERWRERRHVILARRLRLDAQQARALDAGFDAVRPELRGLRQEVFQRRLAYAQALARGDEDAARATARQVSLAQARVDSLCAEAMIRETSVLRPEQRARYVGWTFRGGRGRDRGFEWTVPHGPPHPPMAPDSQDSLHPHEERNSP